MDVSNIVINAGKAGVAAEFSRLIEAEKAAREVYALAWLDYECFWNQRPGTEGSISNKRRQEAFDAWNNAQYELRLFMAQYGVKSK